MRVLGGERVLCFGLMDPGAPGLPAMVPWSSAEINHMMVDRGVMSRDRQPSLQATHRESEFIIYYY